MLAPVGDSILFAFYDGIVGGKFTERRESGILLIPDFQRSATHCRWGKVIAFGSRITDERIKPGVDVLIAPLRWTPGMTYDDIKIWRTTYQDIVAIDGDSIR